jgi:hypothetical protein
MVQSGQELFAGVDVMRALDARRTRFALHGLELLETQRAGFVCRISALHHANLRSFATRY